MDEDTNVKNVSVLTNSSGKYRKNKKSLTYIDPAQVVNRMERAIARRTQQKPNYVPLPEKVKSDLAQKKKEKAQKAAERKAKKRASSMGRYAKRAARRQKKREEDMKSFLTMNPPKKSKKTSDNDDEKEAFKEGINKTAHLFSNMLSQKDASCFVVKHGNNLAVKVTLYPKWADLARSNEAFNITKTEHFKQTVDEWFIEKYHSKDPYKRIANDFNLMQEIKNGKIEVPSDAFQLIEFKDNSQRLVLKQFKKKLRLFCGGNEIGAEHALDFRNYRSINICEAFNGKYDRVPSIECIQCHQRLQAVPIYNIGEGQIFDKTGKDPNKYKVYIYIIVLLCENYPICTFPRSRHNFHKYWVKCAWFNDINGREWNERNNIVTPEYVPQNDPANDQIFVCKNKNHNKRKHVSMDGPPTKKQKHSPTDLRALPDLCDTLKNELKDILSGLNFGGASLSPISPPPDLRQINKQKQQSESELNLPPAVDYQIN